MPKVFIGRKSDFYGKSVWELVCNLKNFGVGRVLQRTQLKHHPEPSWFRIIKAEPAMDEENRLGRLTVERVHRGVKLPRPVVMSDTTADTDYQLVPRHLESDVCVCWHETPPTIELAARISKPPLLLEWERSICDPSGAHLIEDTIPAVYGTQRPHQLIDTVKEDPTKQPLEQVLQGSS